MEENFLNIYIYISRYYSSLSRKYLQILFTEKALSKSEQQKVLENGFQLSEILNRTIIFPKFLCEKRFCNFHDLFGNRIKHLDDNFEFQYREHMFLSNILVPEQVKNSRTLPINISSKAISKYEKNSIKEYFSMYSNVSVIMVLLSNDLHFTFDRKVTNKFKRIFK